MEAFGELETHVRERVNDIKERKKQGAKVVGFVPGFTPEELIYASGAIPLGLIEGGDSAAISASSPYMTRFVDTFCRAQVGYHMSGEHPLYQLPDLVVIPSADDNFRALIDVLVQVGNVEVFRLGVPHERTDIAVDFYVEMIGLLKKKLEEVVGKEIEDNKIEEAIELYNRMRKSLYDLSVMRKSPKPAISGKEFARINHASFVGDVETVTDICGSLTNELKGKEAPDSRPRVLLVASTLAMNDYKVHDILEEAGASVVFEETCEGTRQYWEEVKPDGDLLSALGDKYIRRRTPPPPFFHPPEGRYEFLIEKARDYKVDGIVWYELLYRESYETELFYISRKFEKDLGIPLVVLQSEYDLSEVATFKTRIEAFVESIKGRK